MDRGGAEDLGTRVRGAAEEVEEEEVVWGAWGVVGDTGVDEDWVAGRDEGGGGGGLVMRRRRVVLCFGERGIRGLAQGGRGRVEVARGRAEARGRSWTGRRS